MLNKLQFVVQLHIGPAGASLCHFCCDPLCTHFAEILKQAPQTMTSVQMTRSPDVMALFMGADTMIGLAKEQIASATSSSTRESRFASSRQRLRRGSCKDLISSEFWRNRAPR